MIDRICLLSRGAAGIVRHEQHARGDNPPANQDELDQKDLEACSRLFDSVEQALI